MSVKAHAVGGTAIHLSDAAGQLSLIAPLNGFTKEDLPELAGMVPDITSDSQVIGPPERSTSHPPDPVQGELERICGAFDSAP